MSLNSKKLNSTRVLRYPKLRIQGQRNITQDEVLFLMALAMHGSNEKCLNFIDTLVKKNVSLNSIFLDLIPQTTRGLTSLCDDDFCSYSELILALWRLQNIFNFESPTYSPDHH
jgi:hypothetical protein